MQNQILNKVSHAHQVLCCKFQSCYTFVILTYYFIPLSFHHEQAVKISTEELLNYI